MVLDMRIMNTEDVEDGAARQEEKRNFSGRDVVKEDMERVGLTEEDSGTG